MNADQIANLIFKVPGVTREHDSDVIVDDSTDDGVYLKFMSDGGRTDDRNGMALRDHLWKHNVATTQRRYRSMMANKAALINALSQE